MKPRSDRFVHEALLVRFMGMMNKTPSFALVAAVVALAAMPACGASVALDNRPCPCASGWTCCASRNVCVGPGASCPAPAAPDAGREDAPSDAPPPAPNPVALAKAQSARCMTTDRDHVYWQNANGLIVGAPKAGGDLQISHFQTPIANDPRCGLATDGSNIFGTAYQYGKLLKIALESNGEWVIGGGGTMFGTLSGPSSIALDDDFIYVTEYDGGTIKKLPKSGTGDAVVLASGLTHPHSVVIDDSNVYWIDRGTFSSADAGSDSAAPEADGAVMSVSKNGGNVAPLVTGLSTPAALALFGRRLYFTVYGGSVSAIDVDGKNPATLASMEFAPGPIATDGETVFWGASGVRKALSIGGTPVTLYAGSLPVALAVDGTRVYWADGDEVWSGLK